MSKQTVFLPKGTILKGKRFQYRVETVLGSGGFGITYKVSTQTFVSGVFRTEYYAVKEYFVSEYCGRADNACEMTYSKPVAKDVEGGKSDFISEARRLTTLRHRNIMRVYEAFEANNTAYYVMDYVDGENLRSIVLQNGTMRVDEIYQWATQILDAVKYLHRRRITHLDIKPGNIMMKTGERKGVYPVLIDFGLSKHYDEEDRPTSTIRMRGCSEGYAPREQYAGIEMFNPQADVYAIAASILFCLTATTPPKSTNIEQEGLPQLFPTSIDDRLREIIMKAMEPVRIDRTPSVELLLNDIREWYKTKPASREPEINPISQIHEPVAAYELPQIKQPLSYKENTKPKAANRGKWTWVIVFAIVVFIMSVIIVVDKKNKKSRRNYNSNSLSQTEYVIGQTANYVIRLS